VYFYSKFAFVWRSSSVTWRSSMSQFFRHSIFANAAADKELPSSLSAAEDVAAMGSVAVLIAPSAAIVITSPPAAAPVPKIKVRREAMSLEPVAEVIMADGARMTTDPMAGVAVRRFRASSGYGGHAKGYDSKTANVFSHSICSFSNDRPHAAQRVMWPDEMDDGAVLLTYK
jgi:hypothetical protein